MSDDFDFERNKKKILEQQDADSQVDKESVKRKKEIAINKYSGNGRLELHESMIIGLKSKFVRLKNAEEYELLDSIEAGSETLIPNGTIDTQSPLSYVFTDEKELKKYLDLARAETFDSLLVRVNLILRKYLNVEEHYYTLLAADIIWSYFQDRFPTTHYLIFVGDNGSGKNSALLVFRFLGYRVFYVVSASAANYFTVMGNREEGQVSIAEDEADDIGENSEKRNLLKAGYCSGASIPKIDLEGGRSQSNWLVYSHKWLAMEELKEDKNTKGILHRSFKLNMVAGDVRYNIKDAMRAADDPEYIELQKELIDLRNRLFCFRLLHHKDPIYQVNLNVKGRTAELTKPPIKLFQNSPIALQKILDCLSMFIKERNESSSNSFEAKLHNTIQSLIDGREERKQESLLDNQEKFLDDYQFTNEVIKEKFIDETNAREDPEKPNLYYSPEIGRFGQSKITTILKSKFKVELESKKINGRTCRCVKFKKEYLDRIKSTYDIPEKIEVLSNKPVTAVTAVTPSESIQQVIEPFVEAAKSDKIIEITEKVVIAQENYNILCKKLEVNQAIDASDEPDTFSIAVTGVTGVTTVPELKNEAVDQ